ncbi:sigma-70 family RNA polymerase sigma factor [Olivibacter sp. CPCC 100613]|uniref:RNA polymerase sigma factor n=1 Tax=Olivibacter sp. CPCC 100613 TaxID=3079931 RepID=UPI002FFB7471
MQANQYDSLLDKELIGMLIDSDKQAFDALYYRYSSVLFRYLSKLLADEEMIQDIMQNIFVALWERRKSLSPIASLKGYLLHCAKYQAIDVIRKQIKHRAFEQDYRFSATSVSPMDLHTARELALFLDTCTRALPKKTKEIFDLSRNEQLNHNAIAAKLHIAPTTVKKQISNALKFLRCKLATTAFWNDILFLIALSTTL